jgi:hypothetical protein
MPTETTLPFVKSEGYRTVLIDSASTALLSSDRSDRVIVNLTRIDQVLTEEKITLQDDGGFHTIPSSIPQSRRQKTIEFSVELRPDVAFEIANTLIRTISRLSESRKKLYGIPNNLTEFELLPSGFPPR